jgi:hypothetical protein
MNTLWKWDVTEDGFIIDPSGKEDGWLSITDKQAQALVRWIERNQQVWREQAIKDCIAAVEALEPETQFSGPYQMRRAAVAALRALQEVDTPQ